MALKAPLKVFVGADSFGNSLKEALVKHLEEKGAEVEDVGVGKYYSIAEEVAKKVQASVDERTKETGSDSAYVKASKEVRGILCCGTGMGVGIFANKYRGVYAATVESEEAARNSRSINNSNVLALGAMLTQPEKGVDILDAWLDTEFMAPCPASGGKPWPEDISSFLKSSVGEVATIPATDSAVPAASEAKGNSCPICDLAKGRHFEELSTMQGGSWKVVREEPRTSAVVRFKAGSIEPAHHHTFGHDIIVLSGHKKAFNLTTKTDHELLPGDVLYTPAGHVHRVLYYQDTEFFITWDGAWDILLDEDLDAAKAELKEELLSAT